MSDPEDLMDLADPLESRDPRDARATKDARAKEETRATKEIKAKEDARVRWATEVARDLMVTEALKEEWVVLETSAAADLRETRDAKDPEA